MIRIIFDFIFIRFNIGGFILIVKVIIIMKDKILKGIPMYICILEANKRLIY